ncbi:hypothetical protein ACFL6I_18070 [candidate division KSB1 bacterium]
MKTLTKKTFSYLIVIGFLITPVILKAQLLGTKYGFQEQWYINVNTGFTSFFGDISTYDSKISKKLKHESALAVGGIIGKEITTVIGARYQFLYGSLFGVKGPNSFSSYFTQNSFQLTLNVHHFFFGPYKDFKWNFYGFGGIGLLQFRSIGKNTNLNTITALEGYNEWVISSTPSSAAVYTLGGGIKILFSESFVLNLEGSVSPAGSDKIDTYNGKPEIMGDTYTYVSIGFTYKFHRSYKSESCCENVKHKGFSNSRKAWQKRRSGFSSKKRSLRGSLALRKY